jgi:hypothetical protein
MTRDAKEVVAFALAVVVGVFVLGTLLIVFILALNGIALPDTWTSLFGLVVAIMSALGGWLLGRNSNGSSEDPPTHPRKGD